jgi:hypothetical protein
VLPRRSACPLRKARLDRRGLLDRRDLLDRRVLLGRRGLGVLREFQARRVLLGLRVLLLRRDRLEFGLQRRVVIRPSANFPAMRTNTYSMLTCLMQGEALSITMIVDYHSHPLVAHSPVAVLAKSSWSALCDEKGASPGLFWRLLMLWTVIVRSTSSVRCAFNA